jgi:acetoin utilization deacetylase AcuC-like enzyme
MWYAPEYRLPLTAFGKRTGLEPRRADLVAWYLLEHGWVAREQLHAPVRASYEALVRVHHPDYLESLGDRATLGRIFGVDAWDVPVASVLETVRLATGGTIAAAQAALARRGPALNLLGAFTMPGRLRHRPVRGERHCRGDRGGAR